MCSKNIYVFNQLYCHDTVIVDSFVLNTVLSHLSFWLTPSCCYLIDEAGEAVVETLDLLLLVGSAHRQAGVDLQVERDQQALVNGQGGQRGAQPVVVPVGAHVQGAAAQRDAAEPPLTRTEAAQPPGAGAAPDRVTGADSLGPTQAHGGGEMELRRRRRSSEKRCEEFEPLWGGCRMSHGLLNLPRVE